MPDPAPASARSAVPATTSRYVRRGNALVWVARIAWGALGALGWSAISDAASTSTSPPAAIAVVQVAAAVVWLIGVGAVAIPSVISLTITRILVPAAVVGALTLSLAGGVDIGVAIGLLACGLVAAVAVAAGEFGGSYVQASAYGDETRFVLRAPLGFLAASIVTWLIAATNVFVGLALVVSGSWVIGTVLITVGVAVTAWAWPRWHRMSRRWLVLVPAGVVVHDHLALAETVMVQRTNLAHLRLAPADTQAADLTGPATGHMVEITTREPVTAIIAPSRQNPKGTVIHLTAALVAPTRPGAALADAARRKMPVG